MLIGYARVSTVDQNLALQRDALTEAGCTKIFTEQMSGGVTDRPALPAQWAVAPAHRHGRRLLRLRAGGPYALNCLRYDVSGTHLSSRRPNGPPNFVRPSSVLC